MKNSTYNTVLSLVMPFTLIMGFTMLVGEPKPGFELFHPIAFGTGVIILAIATYLRYRQ